jgi:hypothetical protein
MWARRTPNYAVEIGNILVGNGRINLPSGDRYTSRFDNVAVGFERFVN